MFAYVVVSHDHPEVALRVLRRIQKLSPTAITVLRHDSTSCPPPADLPAHVRLGADTHLQWGHWDMVDAVLQELAWVVEHTEATHAVVISGRDYPVLPLSEWERSVAHLDGLMEAEPLEFRPRWGRRANEGNEMLTRYSYAWYKLPGSQSWTYRTPRAQLANKVAARLAGYLSPLLGYRILPRGRGTFIGVRRRWRPVIYKGSTWMMLSRKAIQHLLAQDLSRFERTLSPDEAAIHTAVLTNPDLNVQLGDLTYASWVGPNPPEVLSTRHLDAIRASGAPFARKVEISPLLDALDGFSAEPDLPPPGRVTQ